LAILSNFNIWLLVAILLMAIGVILSVAIGGYFINDYWCYFIGGYFINGYL